MNKLTRLEKIKARASDWGLDSGEIRNDVEWLLERVEELSASLEEAVVDLPHIVYGQCMGLDNSDDDERIIGSARAALKKLEG